MVFFSHGSSSSRAPACGKKISRRNPITLLITSSADSSTTNFWPLVRLMTVSGVVSTCSIRSEFKDQGNVIDAGHLDHCVCRETCGLPPLSVAVSAGYERMLLEQTQNFAQFFANRVEHRAPEPSQIDPPGLYRFGGIGLARACRLGDAPPPVLAESPETCARLRW